MAPGRLLKLLNERCRPPLVTLDAHARPHAHDPKDDEPQYSELTSARRIYREPAWYLKLLYQQAPVTDILQIHHHRAAAHYADNRGYEAAHDEQAARPQAAARSRR